MPTVYSDRLSRIEAMMDAGLDADATMRILELLEGPALSKEFLEGMKLYSETLPLASEHPFTPAQRYLHFLWDAFDKLPMCLAVPFAMPFRRLIAHRLFSACGKAFTTEENVRFNFGQFLTVGDNVFINQGTFLDSKGGIAIGDNAAIAEYVRVFTHSHSEASHIERAYKPVVIGPYAKVYSGAVLLPGVTVGKQAIVAAGAMVTHDVPDNMVVAGVPAKVIRERRTEGREGEALDHIWLF